MHRLQVNLSIYLKVFGTDHRDLCVRDLAFATASLSPLREHLVFSLLLFFFHLYFFLLSLFSLVFLSYHCFTYIFLITIHLEFIFFFTYQLSLGCFGLVSVFHSTSSVSFSFSYYFRLLRTGILQVLGLFLRFWVCTGTCFLLATLPT